MKVHRLVVPKPFPVAQLLKTRRVQQRLERQDADVKRLREHTAKEVANTVAYRAALRGAFPMERDEEEQQ